MTFDLRCSMVIDPWKLAHQGSGIYGYVTHPAFKQHIRIFSNKNCISDISYIVGPLPSSFHVYNLIIMFDLGKKPCKLWVISSKMNILSRNLCGTMLFNITLK